ncbi:MAG: hypothetical protein J5J06_15950 [Phycisphaerae bacterium]|nr:hypothetical protein [Phycisphaerae bacterium]
MSPTNPLATPAIRPFFESLLPDFVLAFAFFTALAYAVLGKRFDHQKPAVAMSAALGLALAIGLVWWEHQHGWSVRNLGPIAIGFAVILLAMIMFQGIRRTGGSWAGAGIAFGASILVAWVLGFDWMIATEIVQTLAIVALIVGIVAFLIHLHGHGPPGRLIPASVGPELADVRHDMRDLYEDRQVGDRIRSALMGLRQETDVFVEHPQQGTQIVEQLRRLLPAEGWLTERLARLRERAHHVREGHAARIDELRHIVRRLPAAARKKASNELSARYHEMRLDKRLERLDAAVAENERRIKDLTLEARRATLRYDYRRLSEMLEEAEKLQAHNEKLFKIIDRTERKVAGIAEDLAKEYGKGGSG